MNPSTNAPHAWGVLSRTRSAIESRSWIWASDIPVASAMVSAIADCSILRRSDGSISAMRASSASR